MKEKIVSYELLDKIGRKLSTERKLSNKLRRQWGRLVKESLRVAKQQDLEIFTKESHIYPIHDITVKTKSDEIIDDSELLGLAEVEFPSLYRRFLQGHDKHKTLIEELKGYNQILS